MLKSNKPGILNEPDIDYSEVLKDYANNPPTQLSKPVDLKVTFDDKPEEIIIKVALMGDGNVGKTSIRRKYIGEGFSRQYLPTLGADFANKMVQFGVKKIKFHIWDLAGQPRFQKVRKMYYTGTAAAFFVCDVSKPDSSESINNWVNELWKNNGRGPIPFVILGNKADLREEGAPCLSNQVLLDIAAGISSLTQPKFNFRVTYLPTSALTGENITKAFKHLAFQALSHRNF